MSPNFGSFGKLSIVYAVLALFLIIELGLTAYVVSDTNPTPSSFSFMLFTTVWSTLVLIYLAVTPVVLPSFSIPIVTLVLVSLTTLFWFAGSIAMADHIGVPECHGNNFCQSTQAAVAFGFFIWAGFTGLSVLEFLGFRRGGGVSADKPSRPYSAA
ncbi:Membrane-associating domain [Geosmithia morbida]|uniref:Membrane-associating domain n=1 Tax=Geosmithia morbida TaxID=1094350 RepID=A0A9P4YQW7_9HYPO|nr:Membrane-associating domain [Geosmithia morbida]KAF4120400.1 Membrane-associating domain [Geosmithia morbida]